MNLKQISYLLLFTVLVTVNANADHFTMGYEKKSIDHTFDYNVFGASMNEEQDIDIDLLGLSYGRIFDNYMIEFSLKHDIDQSYVMTTADSNSYIADKRSAGYTELGFRFVKPINSILNSSIGTRYSKFSTEREMSVVSIANPGTVGLMGTLDYDNSDFLLEAKLDFHHKYKIFSYGLDLGAILQTGNVKSGIKTLQGQYALNYNYINVGYSITPNIAVNFTEDTKLKLAYLYSQTQNIMIYNDSFSHSLYPSVGDLYVKSNDRGEQSLMLNLIHNF